MAQRIDLESVVHRVHDIGGRAISYKKVESVIACGRLGFDKLESLKGRPALQDIEAQETARAAARVRGLFGVPVQYPGKETVFVDPQPGAPGKDVLPAVDSRSVPELSRW